MTQQQNDNTILEKTQALTIEDGHIIIDMNELFTKECIAATSNTSLNCIKELQIKLTEATLNVFLETEMTNHLNAKKSERTSTRNGLRNGYYTRSLTTNFGKFELHVPRDREGNFKPTLFDKFSRTTRGILATIMEMYISGVSTRKVKRITELYCGTTFSKSTVSEICKKLDYSVEEFRNRPITYSPKQVFIDALYIKVRDNGFTKEKAIFIALGYNEVGKKIILGYDIGDIESKKTWIDFLNKLKNRGLKSPELIISDAHKGILAAIHDIYPTTTWQRCVSHFERNVLDKTPPKMKKEVGKALTVIYQNTNYEDAMKTMNEVVKNFEVNCFDAMRILEDGADSTFQYTAYLDKIQHKFKTNNVLERANEEVRRRAKTIRVFPNVESAIRLIGCILQDVEDEYAYRRRSKVIQEYNR